MIKAVLSIIYILVGLAFAGSVLAAGLTIRIEAPQTPTNQSTFNINFVTLDTEGRAVTVKCFKKGPLDGSFIQFGSDISLSAGGNSANCSINSSVAPGEGTYQFYAQAIAGADSATSETVSVELKTSQPGTPTDYSKSKSSACDYTIKFKTADDGGKTSKVELYRSDNTSFSLDSSTKVAEVGIGSNTQGSFINNVPDCGKEYFYALRAFDSAGNGSGSVGDSVIKVETTTPSTTQTIQTSVTPSLAGAVALEGTALESAQVLGQATESAVEDAFNKVGESTETAEQKKPSNLPLFAGGVFFALLLLYFVYRRLRG